MSCPSDDVLEGALDATTRVHVQGCARCQGRLDELMALGATLDSEKTFARAGPPEDVVAEGAAIGHYRVTRRIGAGAMGAVYAAYDARLEREVALKVLHRELGDLVSESRLLARLSHPNVVTVHEVLPWNDRFVLVMELARGHTLREWLKAAPRSLNEVLDVFRQCAAGLHAAHAAGIVHRDFKPDNALVDETGRARLLDFGLAMKATGAGEAGFGGSPAYLALPQLRGAAADASSDQYAWWASLYEALAHRLPHDAPNFAALLEARTRPVELAPLPAWLRPHLARGLSNDPAARFPDMEAASRALTPPRRWKRVTAAVSVLVVALIAGSVQLARPSPCREVTVRPDALSARVKDAAVREAVSAYAAALETCRAQPAEEQRPRAACLEQTGRELELAIAALEDVPDVDAALHPRVLRRVRPARRCEQTPWPQVTLPSDAERASAIESHRAQLRFDALRVASDFEGAVKFATAHREAMEQVGASSALAWARLNEASALITKGRSREALALVRSVEAAPGLGLRERTWGALGTWLLECYANTQEACETQEKRALLLAAELDEPWANTWRDEIGLRFLEGGKKVDEVVRAWKALPGAEFEIRRTVTNELASVVGDDDWRRIRRARDLATTVPADPRIQRLKWQLDVTVALQEGDLQTARERVRQLEAGALDPQAKQALLDTRLTFLVGTRQDEEATRQAAEMSAQAADQHAIYRALLGQLWFAWRRRRPNTGELERQVALVAPAFSANERAYFESLRVIRVLELGDAEALARLPLGPEDPRVRAWQLAVLRGDEAEEAKVLAEARDAEVTDFSGQRLRVVGLMKEERWADAVDLAAAARAEVDSMSLESQLRVLEAWSRWKLGQRDEACRVVNLRVFDAELVPREREWAARLERDCPRIGLTTLEE